MGNRKASLLVLAAATMWGCMSLFIRKLTADGFSPFEIVAGRMLVGSVGLLVIMLVTDPSKLRIRLRDLWIFAVMGVGATLYNYFYILCINLSEASVAIVLLYTSPIFVMIIGAVLFREKVTPRKVLSLAMTFVGCVLVAGVLGGVRMSLPAFAAGIAGGFFYGSYSIVGRLAMQRYDALTATFYTFLFCMGSCFLLSDVGSMARTISADPTLIVWFIGIGIFCALLPYLFYNWALARMEASRAAILATSEVLVAGALGIFAYGESAGVLKLVGMALIFAAVIVLNTGKPETEEASDAA
ncbi:MAG: EamA family transporter [Eggerthellaceae bacterium]|nr:EamA family transporter [Eggerthellaceae bacterium]